MPRSNSSGKISFKKRPTMRTKRTRFLTKAAYKADKRKNTELKYFCKEVAAQPVTSVGAVTVFDAIPQNGTSSGREGVEVSEKVMVLRGWLESDRTDTFNVVRMIICKSKSIAAGSLVIADLIDIPATPNLAPLGCWSAHKQYFDILHDKLYYLGGKSGHAASADPNGFPAEMPDARRQMLFHLTLPLNSSKVVYEDGATAAPKKNGLFMLLVSDSAVGGGVRANFISQLSYTDS